MDKRKEITLEMERPALEIEGVSKLFQTSYREENLVILSDVRLKIFPGEVVALTGSSGSGKSTLLHIAGLLDHPNEGNVYIMGENTNSMNETQKSLVRNQNIGFVYQFHHLLPEFSALENVMIPQLIKGKSEKEAARHAKDLLSKLNIIHRCDHRPSHLSGGERQRVAICRALANNPQILLADEPTGNLDNDTSEIVFSELLDMASRYNLAAIIATHNLDYARKMSRTVKLSHCQVSNVDWN